MHDVARDSKAQSPRVVPGVAGRARVRVRRPRPWLGLRKSREDAKDEPGAADFY